jgi:ankyrin repeat protein
LTEGADVNYVESTKNEFNNDHNYWTPLYIAAQNGHSAIVTALLNAGADRNFLSTLIRAQSGIRQKWSALHVSASLGHVSVVRALVDNSKIAQESDDEVPTPLNQGTRSNVLNINQQSNEARFDHRSYVTGSAIFRAAMAGRAEVVRILIDAGADATLMNYVRLKMLQYFVVFFQILFFVRFCVFFCFSETKNSTSHCVRAWTP